MSLVVGELAGGSMCLKGCVCDGEVKIQEVMVE